MSNGKGGFMHTPSLRERYCWRSGSSWYWRVFRTEIHWRENFYFCSMVMVLAIRAWLWKLFNMVCYLVLSFPTFNSSLSVSTLLPSVILFVSHETNFIINHRSMAWISLQRTCRLIPQEMDSWRQERKKDPLPLEFVTYFYGRTRILFFRFLTCN